MVFFVLQRKMLSQHAKNIWRKCNMATVQKMRDAKKLLRLHGRKGIVNQKPANAGSGWCKQHWFRWHNFYPILFNKHHNTHCMLTTQPENPLQDDSQPPAEVGNRSNPSPHDDRFTPPNDSGLLGEKAEKYLREVASIEDMPDAQDQQEMDEVLKAKKDS